MKRLLLPLAAAAIAGLVPMGARPAYACSCIALSPEEHVANADVIVIGTVLRLLDDTEEHDDDAFPDVDAVLSVERYLKSTGPEEITVDDPTPHGGCGLFDETSIGKKHLLFLTGEATPFRTSICAGSASLDPIQLHPKLSIPGYEEKYREYAQQGLQTVQAITGPGTLPQDTPAPGESQTGDGVPWLPVITGASLAAGALVAASAYLLRRRVTRG